MDIVVTGATGFLGFNLVRDLNALGHRPVCLKRAGPMPSHCRALNAQWEEDAFRQPRRLRALLAGATVVYHCAARVGTANRVNPAMAAANVELVREMLAAASGGAGRFVHCSTVITCGVSGSGEPVDEDNPYNLAAFGMDSGYARTKREAEELVSRAVDQGLDAVIVNPCFMFGPFDAKPSSCKMLLDICRRAIPGFPAGVNNYVDVRDVARGMIAAAERGRTGERYILGGENLPYDELFRRVARIAAVPAVDRPLPRWLGRVVGRIGDCSEMLTGRESLFNSTGIAYANATCSYTSRKAEQELGYTAGDLDAAIGDALDWFAEHGYL